MKLVYPSIDFFKDIEDRLKSGNRSFIDANVFGPPFYTKEKEIPVNEDTLRSILRLNFDKGKKPFKALGKKIRKYQRNYFESLSDIIDSNSNATTIKKVLEECRDGIIYQRSPKRYKRMKREPEDISQILKIIYRERADGMEDLLDMLDLKKRYIFSEANLGKKNEYEKILMIVEKIGKDINIHSNSKKTDEHLVTNAFYLGICTGEPIDVYSFDHDIQNLFKKSISHVMKELGIHYLKRPDVTIYKISYAPEGFMVVRGRSTKE